VIGRVCSFVRDARCYFSKSKSPIFMKFHYLLFIGQGQSSRSERSQ